MWSERFDNKSDFGQVVEFIDVEGFFQAAGAIPEADFSFGLQTMELIEYM